MEKVRPWCGQPSDRGRLRNRNRNIDYFTLHYISTKWVARSSLEDDTVGGEEHSSLGRQQDWATAVCADALISTISQQVRSHPVNDNLLTWQQRRCQDLRLSTVDDAVTSIWNDDVVL